MLSGSLLIPGLQATLVSFFVVFSVVFLVFCLVCILVFFSCFWGAECASSVVNSSRIRCFTFCVKSHLLMISGLFWGPVWEHFCDCLRTLWTRSDMMLYLFAEASFFEDFGSLCGVLVGTYL